MKRSRKVKFIKNTITTLCLTLVLLNSGIYQIAWATEEITESSGSAQPNITIINQNDASVENDLSADANGAQSTINDTDGDVTSDSSSTSSETDLDNQTNTNTNEIEPPTDDHIDVVVESSNSATVKNDELSESQAGGSDVSDTDGDVDLKSEEATASADLVDIVNENDTTVTEESVPETTVSGETAEPEKPCEESGDVDLDVENNNSATVDNAATVEATGSANTVQDTDGDVTSESDSTTAIANLINFVNTNLTGSEWIFEVINILGSLTGDVNFLEDFLSFSGAESIGDLKVKNTNDGSLINNIDATAQGSSNTVSDTDGDVKITNGDANVLVNLINFLNTNFTGSHWLFSVTNIFGSLIGNVVLPGEGSGTGSSGWGDTDVTNNNESVTKTTINNTASAGSDEVSDTDGDVTIQNAGAVAKTNLLEFINTNIFGLDWLFVIVNWFGDWTGNIIGNDQMGPTETIILSYSLNQSCGCPTCGNKSLEVENNNSAYLENNISATAIAASNKVENTDGDVTIQNGAARSLVNVVNFVNTNITGSNWLFGMVNIFGDWDGDLVFSYPDLSVTKTDGREAAQPGEELTYTISYQNNGQMPASSINIIDTLPDEVTYISDTSGVTPLIEGHSYIWNVEKLTGGESRSFTVTVKINPDLGLGTYNLDNTVAIQTCARESDPNNNYGSDRTVVKVYPDLTISKTDNKDNANPSDELTYVLSYENNGNFSAENVVLTDTLPGDLSFVSASNGGTFSNGKVSWNLETLTAGQSGSLTLTAKVPATMSTGTTNLKNTAEITTTTEEENTENNKATDETTVHASPDLTVSKDDGRTDANPGDELTYTIKYENIGDASASDVVIVDELPAHLSFISASNNGEQAADGHIVWHIGTVGPQSKDNLLTLKVKIDGSMPSGTTDLNNIVKISTTTAEDSTSNNQGTDVTKVEAHPILSVQKTNSANHDLISGENVTFTITVQNTGNSAALEVTLFDSLKNESGEEIIPQNWALDGIAVGEKVIIDYNLAVTSGITAGTYTNTAHAAGKDDRGNGITSNEATSSFRARGGVVLAAATIRPGSVLGAMLPATGAELLEEIAILSSILMLGVYLRRKSRIQIEKNP